MASLNQDRNQGGEAISQIQAWTPGAAGYKEKKKALSGNDAKPQERKVGLKKRKKEGRDLAQLSGKEETEREINRNSKF